LLETFLFVKGKRSYRVRVRISQCEMTFYSWSGPEKSRDEAVVDPHINLDLAQAIPVHFADAVSDIRQPQMGVGTGWMREAVNAVAQ
jgi:hypothetical protein